MRDRTITTVKQEGGEIILTSGARVTTMEVKNGYLEIHRRWSLLRVILVSVVVALLLGTTAVMVARGQTPTTKQKPKVEKVDPSDPMVRYWTYYPNYYKGDKKTSLIVHAKFLDFINTDKVLVDLQLVGTGEKRRVNFTQLGTKDRKWVYEEMNRRGEVHKNKMKEQAPPPKEKP